MMTDSLQRAFREAAKLSPAEQDVLAARLLVELSADDEFDRALERTTDRVATLAAEALAEHRAGGTKRVEPDVC